MREIALDTQAATAVAILEDGRVTGRAHNDSVRHHAESITPLVRDALAAAGLPPVLAEAGIDRILVGTGPAPFTGLRSGLVSARVLARVAGVPAYGVCSLDVIARQGLDLLARDHARLRDRRRAPPRTLLGLLRCRRAQRRHPRRAPRSR